MFPLQLYGSVGPDEDNDPEDVVSVSNALAGLGLTEARDAAQTGAWDNRFDDTVKSFQGSNGLDVDGVLLPGGPTQEAINRSLEVRRSTDSAPALDLARDPLGKSADEHDFNARGRAGLQEAAASRVFAPAGGPRATENAFSVARREFDSNRNDTEWWRSDPDLPRLSDRAANAIAEGARQRETQLTNFLKLLGTQPSAPKPAAAPSPPRAPDADETERVLIARGYRYLPDPMGRIGWGDWVDANGKPLDPAKMQAILARETAPRSKSNGETDFNWYKAPGSAQVRANFAPRDMFQEGAGHSV